MTLYLHPDASDDVMDTGFMSMNHGMLIMIQVNESSCWSACRMLSWCLASSYSANKGLCVAHNYTTACSNEIHNDNWEVQRRLACDHGGQCLDNMFLLIT